MTDDTRPETPEPAAAPSEVAPPPAAADEPAPRVAAADDLARERDEYRELLLRKTAELDNYRKRVDRERAAADEAAAADLITELLPILDNLERALETSMETATAAAYRTGVELIHKQLLDLLAKRRVVPIDTAGRDFDPHYHQAVAHEASGEHAEGQIIGELQRGYMLAGRLLRPAMVRVAKA
jgi:molecular chaperone GrpE